MPQKEAELSSDWVYLVVSVEEVHVINELRLN